MRTILEVVKHAPKVLAAYMKQGLLDLLASQAENADKAIREVVSECVGRLFIHYESDMEMFILDGFKGPLSSSTMAKSIKYSAVANGQAHQMIVPEILDYINAAAGACS